MFLKVKGKANSGPDFEPELLDSETLPRKLRCFWTLDGERAEGLGGSMFVPMSP